MDKGICKVQKNKKIEIEIGIIFYFLFILARLIPVRGNILGQGGLRTKSFLLIFMIFILYKGEIRKYKIPVFYWLYFGIYLICSIHHFSTRSLLNHLYMLVCILGTVYFVLSLIDTEQKFQSALDIMLIIFSVYAFLGIVEATTKINVFDLITGTTVEYFGANELRFGLARNRGAFGVSINNGMILCMILAIAIYKVILERKNKYMIQYILLLTDAFLTLSRTVWIFVILIHVFTFLSLTTYKKMSIIAKIVVVGIAAIAVISVFFPTFLSDFINISIDMINSILGTFGNESVQNNVGDLGNRNELWLWVFTYLKNHYTWGVGFARQFAYRVDGWVKESIEITWLYLLYRIGIVGLVGYWIFQVGCIKVAIVEWKKNKKETRKLGIPDFYYYFLVMTIGYFISQFSVAADPDLEIYYIILGLVLARKNIDSRENLDYDI